MQSLSTNRVSIIYLLPPLLVFILAAGVLASFGLDGDLNRDEAIFLYAGQRMAEGVPPYLSIFDHQPPLGYMVPGLGVVLAKALGWDDILTVRLVFFTFGCLAAVAVFLLARHLLGSSLAAFWAAISFLGFAPFVESAASGPLNKVLTVFLVTASLLMMSEKRWFLAGIFGSLSSLTWLPTTVFPLVTLALALAQPRSERGGSAARALLGIGIPLLVIVVYFAYYQALYQLLEGPILFSLFYLDRGPTSILDHILWPFKSLFREYRTMFLMILIGFATLGYFYLWRRSLHASWREVFTEDRFAPFLLSLPALIIWSFIDYQNAPDFFVFIPYISIGLGFFLNQAIKLMPEAARKFLYLGVALSLLGVAVGQSTLQRDFDLGQQREAAQEIESRFGGNVKLLSVGAPEVLVLIHRINPTRYVYTIAGVDKLIQDTTSAGFAGWLQELQEYDPDIIAFGETWGIYIDELTNWIEAEYSEQEIGPWSLFIKNSLIQ